LRILYDISVLGEGYRSTSLRTGIFRVIESVAKELNKNHNIDLLFCSSKELNSVNNCLLFLTKSNDFKNVKFLYPRHYRFPLLIAKAIRIISYILGPFGMIKLIRRAFQYVEYKFLFFYEKFLIGNLTENLFGMYSIDIFHSPYLALPQNAGFNKSHLEFITIYDLMPTFLPHFFTSQTINAAKENYESIDKNTWVLCISETTRQDLLKYKGNDIDPTKVIVTHLAASDFFYKSLDNDHNQRVLKKYEIPRRPYVLALSLLDPRKNMNLIIDAYIDIVNQYLIDDLNLVLVGPNGQDVNNIIEKIACQPRFKNRIILTGFIPDQDLAAIYSEALMFVYPSFYEGFGLPPLEAMQCGVPVITSNNSSLPEVVGDAAIMIDPTDRTELVNAMYRLYIDEELRNNLSEMGIERAKLFSWKKCTEQTIEAYKLALNTAAPKYHI
jgi:glycosyltransferase involved in cell wall biosynthesis